MKTKDLTAGEKRIPETARATWIEGYNTETRPDPSLSSHSCMAFKQPSQKVITDYAAGAVLPCYTPRLLHIPPTAPTTHLKHTGWTTPIQFVRTHRKSWNDG